uniref:Uncharacterized protein n=1 Tax=Crocodylus porosus TaxID=8502 RepID=A0A7M4F9H9_CROPO
MTSKIPNEGEDPWKKEPKYTWRRFYLFNELKTLHEEREVIRTPAFRKIQK